MRLKSQRKASILFFTVLGICLVALAVALNVGWIILNLREVVLLVLGVIFFPIIIAGLVLNVTAIALSAGGYLSVSPGATGFSGTSTLNWTTVGATVANSVTVGAGAGATIDVTVGGGGNTNFIVDVFGFYA